jgi:hypothetical protein
MFGMSMLFSSPIWSKNARREKYGDGRTYNDGHVQILSAVR